MISAKEVQFNNKPQWPMIRDIFEEEEVSLGLQLTLKDAAKEYQMLEEQEEYLSAYEDSVHSLQKELFLLKSEVKGYENELSYLEAQRETELYYLNGAIIINRTKKEELERNIRVIEARKSFTVHIISKLKQDILETEQKLEKADGGVLKLNHVRLRIKALFHRVFRHPNSSFQTEAALYNEIISLKEEIHISKKQLCKLNEAREQVMSIVRSFSQSFKEISAIESEKDRHAAFTLLVCRTRVNYSKVKKSHDVIPKQIPPIAIPENPKPVLNGISPLDQYSQEELQKAMQDQQVILNHITRVMTQMKRACNSLEVDLTRKTLMIEKERRRIFHSLMFSWERQRMSSSSGCDIDPPPPYEEVPSYELESDEELDNCPLQFLKRNSTLDLCFSSPTEPCPIYGSRKVKETNLPLIDLIDRIRGTSFDLSNKNKEPRIPNIIVVNKVV